MQGPWAAGLYRDVPPELMEEFRQFRARFQPEQVHVGGREWRYLDTASGETVILLLSGAAGVAEMSWRSIQHLASRHRVIAPDYPVLDTMAELVDGIAGILDRQGVARAHVIGGSYGGFVAQVFARRHPGRTASLVLSHTLVPERAAAARVATVTRWMRWLPERAIRGLFRLRLGKLFPATGPPELALSKALFSEIVRERLTKAHILSLLRRVADLGANYSFTPRDLEAWPGRILLLMGSDDPATPEPARQAMTALYPRAETRVFSGAGHLTAILKQEEYFAAIDQFLASRSAPRDKAGSTTRPI